MILGINDVVKKAKPGISPVFGIHGEAVT